MTYKSYKIHTGIVEAMVDAKLDPEEFYEFMGKYGQFIEFGITAKKMDAIESSDLGTANPIQLLDAGTRCFGSFMMDFQTEYENKNLQNKK